MKCRHCGLEIAEIKDPWGYTSYRGISYGMHHVATSANSDGHFITSCADGENEAEPEPTPACIVIERSKLYAQY